MNILGQILLWAGFLSGSLATVFNVEVKDDKWSTINWPWFLISVAVGLVGVVLLHKNRKSAAAQSDKSSSNLKGIKENLENLIANTSQLNKDIGGMKPKEMLNYIDRSLTDDFRDFADGRDSITAEHGLDVFAQVMSAFAAGERSVNRAWCAAADGYVDEAATCIDRAEDFLKQARDALKAAVKK